MQSSDTASEMRDRLVKIIDFVSFIFRFLQDHAKLRHKTKNHMKYAVVLSPPPTLDLSFRRKLDTYRSIQESIDGHKERVAKRQKLLDDKATAVTETATKMLTQIRCKDSL